ncbi:hypothetical protein ACFWP2_25765 [Kitasatospora sp. NPDC058444]|uniref:hypothetical protein n=1 Tax=Kitasatospora sp. NPDC058444 TaxID=3346504 RepID=UPI00364F1D3F
MNRVRIGGVLAAGALLPLAVCAVGRLESRSGGRAVVADTLNRPVLLVGTAAVLLLAARLVRGRRDTLGGVATAVGVLGLLFAAGAFFLASFREPVRWDARTSSPDRADHVLTVVNRGDSEQESNTFDIGLETGTGLSARRWHVLTVQQEFPGQGEFVSAQWSDAGRVRVTTDAGHRVFAVDPGSGEPTLIESVGELKSVVQGA